MHSYKTSSKGFPNEKRKRQTGERTNATKKRTCEQGTLLFIFSFQLNFYSYIDLLNILVSSFKI